MEIPSPEKMSKRQKFRINLQTRGKSRTNPHVINVEGRWIEDEIGVADEGPNGIALLPCILPRRRVHPGDRIQDPVERRPQILHHLLHLQEYESAGIEKPPNEMLIKTLQ